MAELDLRFNENTDTYSDGDIENTLLELAQNGFDITQSNKEYPFAAAYHFSPERENILNWYPFDKNGSCLEIGAGCGAITGMLCKKCAKVVSVDISERRCKINYARHKDIENLKIMACNIQSTAFEEKFDYIVLNGVFEYALSFIHTASPYDSLLALAKWLLKPDGRLFIAIENRIGLKYLNGAAEDHTDNYFLGMNEYAGNDSVRTFTKEELASLAKNAGFNALRFYYPYPDYKFPREIFTDSTVNSGFGAPYANLNPRSFGLYSEQRVSAAFCDEGIMGHFANSFLVELALDKCDQSIDYVKINSLRKPQYQIATAICGGKKDVYKIPLSDKANAHIQKMRNIDNGYPDGITALKPEADKNGLKYPFLEYNSLAGIIAEASGPAPVSTALKAFFGKFRTVRKSFITPEFTDIFGETRYNGQLECIRPANIDLICDNIFYHDGEYIIIDNEWCFDMDIPLGFIIWRCINELYYKKPCFEEKEPSSDVYAAFGIDKNLAETFAAWAIFFADKYVGSDYLLPYVKPLNQISLLDLYNQNMLERSINTACYYDTGSGYTEDGKVYTDITLDESGCFRVTFPIPGDALSIRWDIAEGRLLKCRIDGIENDGHISISPDNASKSEDGFDIFATVDPHYTLTGFSGSEFTVFGQIRGFTAAEAYAACGEGENKLSLTIGEKDTQLRAQAKTIADLRTEAEINERLDKKYIESCESRIKAYFARLIEKQNELEARQAAINDLSAQLEYYRSESERIQRSLGWRFMSVFWRLKAKLTKKR